MQEKTISNINDTARKDVDSEGLKHGASYPVPCATMSETCGPGSAQANVPKVEKYKCPRCGYQWQTDNTFIRPQLMQIRGHKFFCQSCFEDWMSSYVPTMRRIE